MGDFGFAREHFEWVGLEKQHNIGQERVGTHTPWIDRFGNGYQVSNTDKAKELVTGEAEALRAGIKEARSAAIRRRKLDMGQVESKLAGG